MFHMHIISTEGSPLLASVLALSKRLRSTVQIVYRIIFPDLINNMNFIFDGCGMDLRFVKEGRGRGEGWLLNE